jgi:hypothetical protein
MTDDDLWLDRYREICAQVPTGLHPEGPNHPSEFDKLDQAEQTALLYWVRNAIPRGSVVNRDVDSYGIKHHFEDEGFYVTNGAFKGAMVLAGHLPADLSTLNWVFRIRKAPRGSGRDYGPARYTLGRFDREFMQLLLATGTGRYMVERAGESQG